MEYLKNVLLESNNGRYFSGDLEIDGIVILNK
jgi:hypothetical protein